MLAWKASGLVLGHFCFAKMTSRWMEGIEPQITCFPLWTKGKCKKKSTKSQNQQNPKSIKAIFHYFFNFFFLNLQICKVKWDLGGFGKMFLKNCKMFWKNAKCFKKIAKIRPKSAKIGLFCTFLGQKWGHFAYMGGNGGFLDAKCLNSPIFS